MVTIARGRLIVSRVFDPFARNRDNDENISNRLLKMGME